MKAIKKAWKCLFKAVGRVLDDVTDNFWEAVGTIGQALVIMAIIPIIIPVAVLIIIYRKIKGKK